MNRWSDILDLSLVAAVLENSCLFKKKSIKLTRYD